jgi:dipeptidyl aminopeptidase/acylaminoacyl peptidase
MVFEILLAVLLATAPPDGTLVELGRAIEPAEGWRRPDVAKELLAAASVHPVTYVSDGLQVRGYLAKPKAKGRYPVVIFNRGGNRDFGAFTDEAAVYQLATIASWGYVVAASQYRGNGGGEGREEFGGAEVADVVNLFPLLEHIPEADPKRIGMIGWSRGGMMTYLALARTDRVSAAIIVAGISDAAATIRERPEMEAEFEELVPNFDTEKDAQLAARSAIRWPEKLHKSTPILLLQGSADWRVDPGQTLAMASALLAARHPFRLIVFEGGDHGLSEYREEVVDAQREWLARYVRDRKPWPSLEPHGR